MNKLQKNHHSVVLEQLHFSLVFVFLASSCTVLHGYLLCLQLSALQTFHVLCNVRPCQTVNRAICVMRHFVDLMFVNSC